jgi:hypothetical protein
MHRHVSIDGMAFHSLRNRSAGGGSSVEGGSFKGGSFKIKGGSSYRLQAAVGGIKLPWEKKSQSAEEGQVRLGWPKARARFPSKS